MSSYMSSEFYTYVSIQVNFQNIKFVCQISYNQVIYQLIKFFMVYITTLIAFGMVLFVMLAKDTEVFDNPWTSFLKVLIMMIGEYDFADNFTFNHISENQVVGWKYSRRIYEYEIQIQIRNNKCS